MTNVDYSKNAANVAEQLIGKTMNLPSGLAQIVETEAYEGGDQTPKRHCMLLAPGQIGIMNYRGHHFVNIGAENAGVPSCVLIRAINLDGELIDGPGRVGKAIDGPSLEYNVLETNISVTGKTMPSTYTANPTGSDNSLGIYRMNR